MARKFLQLGSRSTRRYANQKGGRTYDKKTGKELPRTENPEKAAVAAILYGRYVAARQHTEYDRRKNGTKRSTKVYDVARLVQLADEAVMDACPGDHQLDLDDPLPGYPCKFRLRVRPDVSGQAAVADRRAV